LYGGRPRPRRHCIWWRPSSPFPKRCTEPHFSAHVYCGQTFAHLSNCWVVVGARNRAKILRQKLTDLSVWSCKLWPLHQGICKKSFFSNIIHTLLWLFTLFQNKKYCKCHSAAYNHNCLVIVIWTVYSRAAGCWRKSCYQRSTALMGDVFVFYTRTMHQQMMPKRCLKLYSMTKPKGIIYISVPMQSPLQILRNCPPFYSAPQCSHCKRCISYNSVCLSVRPTVGPSVGHTPVLCQNDGTEHGAVCTVG